MNEEKFMSEEVDIIKKLRTEFVFSAKESIEDICNELAELEKEFSEGIHMNIARNMHSIKGSAGSFEIDSLVSLAHSFEEVFNYLTNSLNGQSDYLFNLLDDMLLVIDEYLKEQSDKDRLDAIDKILKSSLAKSSPEVKFKALIVDSSKVIYSSCQKICPNFFKLSHAKDGLSALSLITTEGYDLVIVSKSLPKLSGIGCIAAAKSDPKAKNTYFVLISSDSFEMTKQLGPDKIILKNKLFYEEIQNILTNFEAIKTAKES